MSAEFIGTVFVPAGLIIIMFSLGLSLSPGNFRRLLESPRDATVGLFGQLVMLPLIALVTSYLFQLPPNVAVGLMILAACPGGVTSNALVFAARADVALSVTLTVLSSCITVFTTPLVVSVVLELFYPSDAVPELSVLKTMRTLFLMTVLPVCLGMLVRHLFVSVAVRLVDYLRPTSIVILLGIIGSSLLSSFDMVISNLAHSAPAAFLLNASTMFAGYLLATRFGLGKQQVLTVSIEVGVQNATMATFITLSVLGSMELAIGPTIYGFIMVLNAFLLIRWHRR